MIIQCGTICSATVILY